MAVPSQPRREAALSETSKHEKDTHNIHKKIIRRQNKTWENSRTRKTAHCKLHCTKTTINKLKLIQKYIKAMSLSRCPGWFSPRLVAVCCGYWLWLGFQQNGKAGWLWRWLWRTLRCVRSGSTWCGIDTRTGLSLNNRHNRILCEDRCELMMIVYLEIASVVVDVADDHCDGWWSFSHDIGEDWPDDWPSSAENKTGNDWTKWTQHASQEQTLDHLIMTEMTPNLKPKVEHQQCLTTAYKSTASEHVN